MVDTRLFDLLQYSMLDATMNERTAASLWQEFGIATKGARQLSWSRGLKKLLLIEEKPMKNWRKKQNKMQLV